MRLLAGTKVFARKKQVLRHQSDHFLFAFSVRANYKSFVFCKTDKMAINFLIRVDMRCLFTMLFRL